MQRRVTQNILNRAEAGLQGGNLSTNDSTRVDLNDSRELPLITGGAPEKIDMNKLAMALAPIGMNCLSLELTGNPIDSLNQYIAEIKKNPHNPELIALKYLKMFNKKNSYHISQKGVQGLLPTVNVRVEKHLLKRFGVNKLEVTDISKKEAVYSIQPYVYILAVMVNSAQYDNFDKRIEFAFKMYDNNNDGKIDVKDLRDMLVTYAKEDQLRVEDQIIEELADAILHDMTKDGQSEYATVDDFKAFLKQYKMKDVKIGVFDKDAARTSVFKPNALPGADNSDYVPKNIPQMEMERAPKKKANVSKMTQLRVALKLDGVRYFWMTAWAIACVVIFIHKFVFMVKKTGMYSVGFAKGNAQLINFNIMILILLANKGVNTFLRLVKLSFIMPLDVMITFHKLVAKWIFIFAFNHAFCHVAVDLPIISSLSQEELDKVLDTKMVQIPYWKYAFTTLPGITGILVSLCFITLGIGTLRRIRKSNFEAFWYSHKLWIAIVILLSLHGRAGLLLPPQTIYWLALPVAVMLCDKFYTLYLLFLSKPLRIRNLEFLESGVIELKLTKPKDFKFVCGQYALVHVPKLSKLQWHPFSISSSKRDPYISFHISPAGDWTNSLKALAQEVKKNGNTNDLLPPVYVQGPYGAPSQTYDTYKHLIIITTGVGATPFSSILRRLNQKANEPNSNFKTVSVDFYWVNRKPASHTWLKGLLQDMQSNDKFKSIIKINIFLTSLHAKYDLRSLLLWRGLAILASKGRNIKGLEHFNVVHWGRPNWGSIFRQKAKDYPKGTEVGVFFCGNKAMGAKLYEQAQKNSGDVLFEFHREVF